MDDKANRRSDDDGLEANLDELGSDPREVGPESGGQSGDAEQLPTDAGSDPESVQELAEEEQAFEAGVVDGVEDAGDNPERPVRSREDPRPRHESELPPDPDWK